MTNPTPHGQVPEALRLAEEITNLECSSEAVAKTIAAAADELCRLHVENASLRAQQPASPPAEQQAKPKTAPGDTDGCKQALGSNNCMQCCVSYMLGLPLVDVPHFADGGGWDQFASFVESKGYSAVMLPGEHEPEADYLASGRTERGTSHMVVMNDGKLVFDPHPSNAGLSSVQCVWLLAKRAAPKQEAQEPVATIKSWTNGSYWRNYKIDWHRDDLPEGTKLYTAPQPAPAPLSDDVVKDAARYRWLIDQHWIQTEVEWRLISTDQDSTIKQLDAAIDAAIAAHGICWKRKAKGDTP